MLNLDSFFPPFFWVIHFHSKPIQLQPSSSSFSFMTTQAIKRPNERREEEKKSDFLWLFESRESQLCAHIQRPQYWPFSFRILWFDAMALFPPTTNQLTNFSTATNNATQRKQKWKCKSDNLIIVNSGEQHMHSHGQRDRDTKRQPICAPFNSITNDCDNSCLANFFERNESHLCTHASIPGQSTWTNEHGSDE